MPLILLAEDESSTVEHVRSALSSQGWLVKTVRDRDQALRAASEFAPQLVLINDHLAGAEDLVRTFSRRSGGPGVVLLTTDDGVKAEATAASADVDAILAKPLDTNELIETIRQGLVNGKGKPTPLPIADTNQVFSTEEIFGDLLGDILDPEEQIESEERAAAPAAAEEPKPKPAAMEPKPRPKPAAKKKPAIQAAPKPEPKPKPEPEPEPRAEEKPVVDVVASAEIVGKSKTESTSEPLAVTGLEDLEEVVREGVEAWADMVHPEEDGVDESEAVRELEQAAQPQPEPEPEAEEDLDSKLDDTLAGVLAESLSHAGSAQPETDAADTESDGVDALLSQALGDLDLSSTLSTSAAEEAIDSTVDDEIEALTAAVEIEPVAEIETPEMSADLAGLDEVAQTPLPIDTEIDAVTESELEEPIESVEATEEVEEPIDSVETADEVEEEVAAEPAPEEPAAPRPAPTKTVEFGEYTLEQQIGVGGMASVWKARRKGVEGFEKRVAIKKILPQAAENEDFVEMFIDEAKLAAQLNHGNITHIYDLGKIDDDYFIAMEYVEGKNLRQILDKTRKKQQPVPLGVALFVAAQIADALDYAHRSRDFDDAEMGLVHRDVSPQNVLISFEGDIKLCDFGIAKAVSKISTTQMGALKGKLQYMSPEQAWGKAIDHRSDLFSLGTLLYEMLTGERLFTGESEMAVLEAVREADVGAQIIQNSEIPAGVKGVLLRALAREPSDRFDSAAELQRGLEELLKEESPAPGPKSLSAFVRNLLDMQVVPDTQAEPPEAIEEVEASEQLEMADELEWMSDSAVIEEQEEDETTSWLRRLLTRLLPVILVVAVGGGIIAALMQKDDPAAESTTETAPPVSRVAAFEPATVSEQSAVDPQGQPPPKPAAARPTPAPPAKPQPQDPEPEPSPAKKPPVAAAVVAPTPEPPKAEATVAATDPELERQVEEDLQRVQELMAGSDKTSDPVDAESTETPATEPPLNLESLWSDVTAGEETEGEVETQPGPGVVEPTVLEFVQPEFTEAARQAGVEGTIRVSVLVGEDGRAQEVRLIEGINSQVGLEEALIEAARNALYQPATKDGEPVEMWYQVAVFFQP